MVDSYKPTQVNQFSARLNEILQSPDKGQVLYRYRINGDEFEQLQQYLIRFNALFYSPDLILKYSCPLDMYFVLYASEWWRRCYEGEWSWKGILESIGLDPEQIDSQTRVNIVENGLKKWQRTILQNEARQRHALGSIACEGGLPIHHMNKSKGSWTTQLIKPALVEKAMTGDARFYLESNEHIIPKSYGRPQTIKTFVELIDDIYRLIQEYKLDTQAKPVEYLNQKAPDWNERFPFPLEAGPAQKMLYDLIVESVENKRKSDAIKTEAVIDNWQNVIELKRILDIDCATSEVSLSASITAPSGIPLGTDNINHIGDDNISIDFHLQTEDLPQGHWFCYPVQNQKRLKLERRNPIIISSKHWQDGVIMTIRNSIGQLVSGLTDNQNSSLNPYQNASMYEIDPTIPFMANITNNDNDCSAINTDRDAIQAVYMGSYSQQCKQDCAVVYIPSSSATTLETGSQLEALAEILAGKLYLLTGAVAVECQQQRYHLKTNSQDANYHYEISGRRLLDFEYPATTIKGRFRIKQTVKSDTNDWSEVSKDRIRLMPLTLNNTKQAFKPLSSYLAGELLGCFRLQVLDNAHESVVFQQTIGLVPKDFKYRLMPLSADSADSQKGKICFSTEYPIRLNVKSEHTAALGVVVDELTSHDNDFILKAKQTPLQKLALEMSFIADTSSALAMRPMRFSCYFPSSNVVIYDDDGQIVDEGHHNFYHTRPFNINSLLYGYRIKVFNAESMRSKNALLEFSLRSDPDSAIINPVSIGAGRFLELEPYRWVDKLKSLLSFSQVGLDDEVCVKLYIDGSLKFEIKFSYYDYELDRNTESQTIQLKTNSRLSITENFDNPKLYDCYQSTQLRAINLRHPDHNAKFLDKTDDGADYGWLINTIKREAGTWLIYSESKPIISAESVSDQAQVDKASIKQRLSNNVVPQIRSTVWAVADKPQADKSEDYLNSLLDSVAQLDLFSSQPEPVLSTTESAKPSLKNASTIADKEQRNGMIATVLTEMAFDVDHKGWEYMKHLTQACMGLPLVTLDNWQVAKRVPEFMCAVLVLGDTLLSEDIVKKVRNEIGFVWELMSLTSFTKIWELYTNLVDISKLKDKQDTLEEVSSAFATFFICLNPDFQPYQKYMIEDKLQEQFIPLFNRKQEANERWPNDGYIQDIVDAARAYTDDNYQLHINEKSDHPYIVPIVEMPALLAWLSVYSHSIDNSGDTETLIALRNELLAKPLIIYNMKQFAPHWFKEAYDLLVQWFNYCKSQ